MFRGCKGDDELSACQKRQELVIEIIDLYHQDGKSLPAATARHNLANRLQGVV
jgi:hypothetical protein